MTNGSFYEKHDSERTFKIMC